MSDVAKCELCGEPMPKGEEMFKFHGYSGPCPKPPLKSRSGRELTSHKVNGLNEAIRISVLDEPGSGGANHVYEFGWDGLTDKPMVVSFQNGPISESGVNGVSNEALLAVVEDRLKCFQSGPYSCRENAVALTKIQEAMMWLQRRTIERMQRGVEGTSAK